MKIYRIKRYVKYKTSLLLDFKLTNKVLKEDSDDMKIYQYVRKVINNENSDIYNYKSKTDYFMITKGRFSNENEFIIVKPDKLIIINKQKNLYLNKCLNNTVMEKIHGLCQSNINNRCDIILSNILQVQNELINNLS